MNGFTDISGHWAEKAIIRCVEAGLMTGRADTTFAPNDSMTRAEVATVLARLLDKLNL